MVYNLCQEHKKNRRSTFLLYTLVINHKTVVWVEKVYLCDQEGPGSKAETHSHLPERSDLIIWRRVSLCVFSYMLIWINILLQAESKATYSPKYRTVVCDSISFKAYPWSLKVPTLHLYSLISYNLHTSHSIIW